MAQNNSFKTYQRGRRQYDIDTNFSGGMMFTKGAVAANYAKTLVNYDIHNEGDSLMPRAGLRISELVLPDFSAGSSLESSKYHSLENISIMAAKECVEQNVTYKQFILGSPGIDDDPTLWVLTSGEPVATASSEGTESVSFDVNIGLGEVLSKGEPCTYFTAPSSKIHGVPLVQDSRIATIVGTFGFGNSFYFINPQEGLKYTYMPEASTNYIVDKVEPKQLDPSEAVTYGYNMLLKDKAYTFINTELQGNLQFTGILPYSVSNEDELLMTPRYNEDLYLKCYFKGQKDKKYKFVWEWRNVGDDSWHEIQTLEQSPVYTIVGLADDSVGLNDGTSTFKTLQTTFKAPTAEILVRVQAFPVIDGEVADTVEKAMTVGFDFSLEMYGNTANIEQEVYDLSTATGMEFWQNRLVLWGIAEDPTILFISDVNDPSYFPYPNNISIYDEPIICVKPFMNDLLVFTTNAIHQVSLGDDGTSWKTTVVQSNLKIEPWDKHLIQIVRNMVFFKSGNYYYMMVPKAQDTTGKLTLAPVSNSVVEFFNNFEHNVAEVLQDTFNYQGAFELINYYNFLDYEDVHNIYVYRYDEDGRSGYFHFDMLYNTVTRAWRIYTYESPHFIHPFRQDATQRGVLASTSLLQMQLEEGAENVFVTRKNALRSEATETYRLDISEMSVDFGEETELYVRISDSNGVEYFRGLFDYCSLRGETLRFKHGMDTYLYASLTFSEEGLYITGDGFVSGSVVSFYDKTDTNLLYGPVEASPKLTQQYIYPFASGTITDDAVIECEGVRYSLRNMRCELCTISEVEDGYLFKFSREYPDPPTISVVYKKDTSEETIGRCIQLYTYDSLNMQDLFIPSGLPLKYQMDVFSSIPGYDLEYMTEAIEQALLESSELLRFKNWQFLDTGYRDLALERNKRYRELQFQLNNINGDDLRFGLEFLIDGDRRTTYYKYDVEHNVDPESADYGLIYVTATPTMNLPVHEGLYTNEAALDSWVLEQSRFPEVALWKVRAPVSGKGQAPRVRLLSKNVTRYELMSINWVYRMMNVR